MLMKNNTTLTEFIYDLNIFQREQLDADGEYKFFGPWYIHVYEYNGNTSEEVLDPIELTQDEYNSLISNDTYFENQEDVWYGLQGFLEDKVYSISDRLKTVFESLPKYKTNA